VKVSVITVSDRAASGAYEDRSGPAIREILAEHLPQAAVVGEIVADEPAAIREALIRHLESTFILTTGGTGLSPRDVTPDVTQALCDRSIPGIAEMLRAKSLEETHYAALSRGYAGQKGNTVIVNFPGSVRGVTLCTSLVVPLMEHAELMMRGDKH
jgi:molybdopterin adenylyltransferase